MEKKILGIGLLSALGAVVVLASFGASNVLAYRGEVGTYGPNHTEEREAEMTKYFETNDFEGWKTYVSGQGHSKGVMKKITTQEQFEKYADAHELEMAGKTSEAAAIRSELGLGVRMGSGQGNGGSAKGSNNSGNFVDNNGDGSCDNL